MDLFYAATTITIGDGRITSFWHSPWLASTKPKDIALSIFAISSQKNFTVKKTSQSTRDFSKIFGLLNLIQVTVSDLWTKINEAQLVERTPDGITWKFTNSGSYRATLSYKAQFEGMIDSFMMEAVWKN
jgi:hypothetical protein